MWFWCDTARYFRFLNPKIDVSRWLLNEYNSHEWINVKRSRWPEVPSGKHILSLKVVRSHRKSKWNFYTFSRFCSAIQFRFRACQNFNKNYAYFSPFGNNLIKKEINKTKKIIMNQINNNNKWNFATFLKDEPNRNIYYWWMYIVCLFGWIHSKCFNACFELKNTCCLFR